MKLTTLLFVTLFACFLTSNAQTPLTTAIDFNVKTLDGEIIELFPLLDEGKIVVLDFFSTSCGPCQTFAYDFQLAYEGFGSNTGNVFFLGVNYNGTNEDVRFFDSLFNINLPSASGLDGGGNKVFDAYLVAAYPTVIVIKPDLTISAQYIWEPTVENITDAVLFAGGVFVGTKEQQQANFAIYPNPAADFLYLRLDQAVQIERIIIKNVAGQKLQEHFLNQSKINQNQSEIRLDVNGLANGLYMVEVITSAGMYSQKLMIHK
jgi:thiol-disulfide isomerase/thioredoxin